MISGTGRTFARGAFRTQMSWLSISIADRVLVFVSVGDRTDFGTHILCCYYESVVFVDILEI